MRKHNWLRHILSWLTGGLLYMLLEILWRGHTHWTMGVLAFFLCIPLDLLNEWFDWDLGLVWQSIVGGLTVTVFEFGAGVILNLWLCLGVWDYSTRPLNLLGQVCMEYTILWCLLACPVIVVFDVLEWKLCGGEKPRYRII